ncbi:MAG: hypothetical protein M3Y69_03075, partial [Verrucomicrobiota bacterium]|nr:hypothetical protein [Verrucomicrobiota bacterium]
MLGSAVAAAALFVEPAFAGDRKEASAASHEALGAGPTNYAAIAPAVSNRVNSGEHRSVGDDALPFMFQNYGAT